MLGHTLPVCSSSLYFPHSPVQGALVTSLLGPAGGGEGRGAWCPVILAELPKASQ